MAETAFQTQYRQEMIATFEVGVSLAYQSTTHEAVISGNTATFLVAGSGGATAVTRGVNGLIPSRPNDLTQVSCTLAEWHDKPTVTGFNIFASQGNLRSLMQRTTMEVVNRKLDDLIITELNTATNDVNSTGEAASVDMIAHAQTILGNNNVPFDGQISALITPAFNGYLNQIPEYASADYVMLRTLDNNTNNFANVMKAKRWMDVNWIVHPALPGVATASEKCFMYHKSAIGCAMDTEGMKCPVGYDDEDDYSWSRCTAYTGAKLLQNSGVVVMTHDGSNYVAS